MIWPHGLAELKKFHEHLNSQNQSIQFTHDEESNESIPFLDTLVERKGFKATTSVYRKLTNTDRYIQFDSHHYPRVLSGIIRNLRDRANNICMGSSRHDEPTHLNEVFQSNGYPKSTIKRVLHAKPRSQPLPSQTEPEQQEKKVLFTPYVRGISEKI